MYQLIEMNVHANQFYESIKSSPDSVHNMTHNSINLNSNYCQSLLSTNCCGPSDASIFFKITGPMLGDVFLLLVHACGRYDISKFFNDKSRVLYSFISYNKRPMNEPINQSINQIYQKLFIRNTHRISAQKIGTIFDPIPNSFAFFFKIVILLHIF